MSTEQRRALADTIPTTEVIKDAVTFPRERLGEPLDISPERFEAWLAEEVRKAKAEAFDEGWKDRARRDVYRAYAFIDERRDVPGPPASLNPYRETGGRDEQR